jgi:hypothetical protein
MRRRIRALGEVLGPAIASIRLTIADSDLRRLLWAWFTQNAGSVGFFVVASVIAYGAGGAVAVGILGLARFVPQMLVAPFAGLPAARWRSETVLKSAFAARTAIMAITAIIVAAGLPLEALYAAVAVEAAFAVLARPLHMALLPAVARSPAQLVGANVGSSAAEGLGVFLGPALAGLLLVVSGPLAATVAVAVTYALGVAAIATLTVPAVGRPTASARVVIDQLSAGVRTVTRLAGPRIIFVGIGAQTFVRGALGVLIIVASIELLGMGEGGVGTLTAAIGLGGLIGAALATVLADGRRLGRAFVVALAGWGIPIAVIGVLVSPLVAIGALLVVGLSNAVFDVAVYTLLQRLTPNASRVAVLGLLELVANGAMAAGGIVAPFVIDAVGVEAALVLTGALLPLVALGSWPIIRGVDESGLVDPRRIGRIRGEPLFAPLSLSTVEHLAESLAPRRFDDGAWLLREGEPGDDFLVIDEGSAEVSQGGRPLRILGPGESCGEIALLEDVPRTASVRAVGPVAAFSLSRLAFLDAMCGYPASRTLAAARASDRRAADAERVALH